ncbi:uncharacterized protein EI90DRAFT_3030169 [Cantharellus anzutake]|uniref:uncharacterized protein n=1 Tax=Cantharellus anzutake TaxID=1750568 RepID=UPI00190666EE|nr:uncharacterized protein EI90DRAFT_3030169 [Cantharellus anzutake]KAF8342772.1 hypothetical protein EI90DRAFT_3030169 [Cantharellus anzutake]
MNRNWSLHDQEFRRTKASISSSFENNEATLASTELGRELLADMNASQRALESKLDALQLEHHRQRLDRLAEVRSRKQNLLNGDDGQGRSSRRGAITMGDMARSDLELDQIMASLVNEDMTNPDILARKNLANVPDMVSVTDPKALRCQYIDNNGLVLDPVAFADSTQDVGDWSFAEREIFIRAYLATPKQFGRIAEQLPHKTREQCVLFYYLNKHSINFKGLIAKQNGGRGRRGGRRPGRQKTSALLKDLRRPQDDYDDASPADSSPAPPSESDAGPSRLRRETEPRKAALISYQQISTDSDIDSDDSQLARKPGRGRTKATETDLDPTFTGKSRPKPKSGKGSSTQWTAVEKNIFMTLLPKYGKNWALIADSLPDKTPMQVRNYFQNHSVELGLPAIAARAEKPPRGAGNPNKIIKPDESAPNTSPLPNAYDPPVYPVVSVQPQRSFTGNPNPTDSRRDAVNGSFQSHYVQPEKPAKDIFIQQRIPSQPSS